MAVSAVVSGLPWDSFPFRIFSYFFSSRVLHDWFGLGPRRTPNRLMHVCGEKLREVGKYLYLCDFQLTALFRHDVSQRHSVYDVKLLRGYLTASGACLTSICAFVVDRQGEVTTTPKQQILVNMY